jgi:hypothetical protein
MMRGVVSQADPLTVLLLAGDSRYASGCFKVRLAFPVLRAKPVAGEREGPILVGLAMAR